MPELTYDPLGRRNVLLAPERARRGAPPVESAPPDRAPCDFCGGQELHTPPETFSIRDDGSAPDAPGWRVRVVPNLYPATPLHEVVVHTPDHSARYEDMPDDHRTDVLRAYAARLSTAPTPANVVVWNRGRASGASRTHEHGQLFGLEATPPTLEREQDAFQQTPCVLCGFVEDDDLAIGANGGVRLIAHPAPFVADELLIVPRHAPRLDGLSQDELVPVAETFADAIRRTLSVQGDGVPFNLVVHTAPSGVEHFHWHAHLMPRTAIWGGLEMGAELPVVAADPHETAARLRAVAGSAGGNAR